MAGPRSPEASLETEQQLAAARRRKYFKWLFGSLLVAGIIVLSVFTFGIPAIVAGAIALGGSVGVSGTTAAVIGLTTIGLSTIGVSALIVNIIDIAKGIGNAFMWAFNKMRGKSTSEAHQEVRSKDEPSPSRKISSSQSKIEWSLQSSFSMSRMSRFISRSKNTPPFEQQSPDVSPLERISLSINIDAKDHRDYIELMAQGFLARNRNLLLSTTSEQLLFEGDRLPIQFSPSAPNLDQYKTGDYVFYKDEKDNYYYIHNVGEKTPVLLDETDQLNFREIAKQDAVVTLRKRAMQHVLMKTLAPVRYQNEILQAAIPAKINRDIEASKDFTEAVFITERWIAIMYRCYQLGDFISAKAIANSLTTKKFENLSNNCTDDARQKLQEVNKFLALNHVATNLALVDFCIQKGSIPVMGTFAYSATQSQEQYETYINGLIQNHPLYTTEQDRMIQQLALDTKYSSQLAPLQQQLDKKEISIEQFRKLAGKILISEPRYNEAIDLAKKKIENNLKLIASGNKSMSEADISLYQNIENYREHLKLGKKSDKPMNQQFVDKLISENIRSIQAQQQDSKLSWSTSIPAPSYVQPKLFALKTKKISNKNKRLQAQLWQKIKTETLEPCQLILVPADAKDFSPFLDKNQDQFFALTSDDKRILSIQKSDKDSYNVIESISDKPTIDSLIKLLSIPPQKDRDRKESPEPFNARMLDKMELLAIRRLANKHTIDLQEPYQSITTPKKRTV